MNPYSAGPAFPNLAPTINNFVDNLVRLKTHQQDIDLRGRQLEQQQQQFNIQQFGTGTPQPGMQTLQARQVATQEQEAMRKPPLPEFQQRIQPSEVLQKKVSLASALGEGAVKKVFAPVFDIIDEVASANPNTTKWDAYENAKAAWAGQRDEVVANAEKYITGPEFQKLKPAQQEAFTELYNTMKYDKTGEIIYDKMLFRNTVASKQAADENTKAALLSERLAAQQQGLRDRLDMQDKLTTERIRSAEAIAQARQRSSEEIAQARLDAAGAKGPSPTEKRQIQKDITEAETKILKFKTNEEAAAQVDFFNQHASKPYVYQWKPGKMYGGDWTKVKLPVINKKQVTAKDVYSTAEARGMTYEEVLNFIGVK